MEKIKHMGARVQYPISLPERSGMIYKGEGGVAYVGFAQFRANLKEFLDDMEDVPVRSIDELVEFNKQHAERTMPEPHTDQDELLKALNNSASPQEIKEALHQIRQVAGAEGLDKAFKDHKLDVLVAPSDSTMCSFTAATGYPIGVVPLGYLANGQPQGLTVVARAYEEHKMVHFMRAFEATFPRRKVPPLLDS